LTELEVCQEKLMKLADERAPPSMPSKTLWPHRFSGVRGRWRNSPTFELQPRTGDRILSEMPLHCQLTIGLRAAGSLRGGWHALCSASR